MPDPLPFPLHQDVSRRDDPAVRAGRVVGYVLTPQPLVIVRWSRERSSFEAVDDLVPTRPQAA